MGGLLLVLIDILVETAIRSTNLEPITSVGFFSKYHSQPSNRFSRDPYRGKRNCSTTVPGTPQKYAAESSLRPDRTSLSNKMAASVTGEWPDVAETPGVARDWSSNGPIGMRAALRLSLDAQLNVSTALCLYPAAVRGSRRSIHW